MALLYRGPTVAPPAPVRLQPIPDDGRSSARRRHPQLRFALGQLAFLAAAIGVYFVVRSLTEGAVAAAERNAGWVVDVERWLGIFVERDTPGFRIGHREFMMGLRGIPEGELHFAGCEVPRENLLVGPGDGFKRLMNAYNGQRLGAATVALGIAQGAYERALAYAGSIAEWYLSELTVLHVVPTFEPMEVRAAALFDPVQFVYPMTPEQVEERLRDAVRAAGVTLDRVRVAARAGEPTAAILNEALATEADLVVTALAGRSELRDGGS